MIDVFNLNWIYLNFNKVRKVSNGWLEECEMTWHYCDDTELQKLKGARLKVECGIVSIFIPTVRSLFMRLKYESFISTRIATRKQFSLWHAARWLLCVIIALFVSFPFKLFTDLINIFMVIFYTRYFGTNLCGSVRNDAKIFVAENGELSVLMNL